MEYVSMSPAQTQQIAAMVYHRAKEKAREGICIGLCGDLGVGKTVFAKGFLSAAGVDAEEVISPTFVIMQEYKVRDGITIHHFDLYRLDSIEDLMSLGYDEYLTRCRSISLIEWADKFKDSLPEDTIWVSIKFIEQSKRKVTVTFPGSSIG